MLDVLNRKAAYLSLQSFGETGMSKSNFSSSIRPDPLEGNATNERKIHKKCLSNCRN